MKYGDLITTDQLIEELKNYSYTALQWHHTWSPDYADFTGTNHRDLQDGMRRYHVEERGWSDIGQHVTLFPDGLFMVGRDFDRTPAGITGYNTGAFMFEMLGNFDIGKDQITDKQWNAAIELTKYLASTGADYIFHRDYADKTCPGSAITKDMVEMGLKMEKIKLAVLEWCVPEGWTSPIDTGFVVNDRNMSHARKVMHVFEEYKDEVDIIVLPPNAYGVEYLQAHPEIDIVSASQGGGAISRMSDYSIPQLAFCAVGNDGDDGESKLSEHPNWHGVGAINEKINSTNFGYWESSYGKGTVEFACFTNIPTPFGVLSGTSGSCPMLVINVLDLLLDFYKLFGSKARKEEVIEIMKQDAMDLLELGSDLKTGYGLYLYKGIPNVMRMTENSTTLVVDGSEVESDVPAQIVDGRMMLPIRRLELLGLGVAWDDETRTATIIRR